MTTPENEPHIRVTLAQVYQEQQAQKETLIAMNAKLDQVVKVNQALDAHDKRLDNLEGVRLPKIEAQLAAQWVVVGIIVVGLGGLLVRAFTG